jgi:EAL and modified HD-GYP domain-containing signal transduction protein
VGFKGYIGSFLNIPLLAEGDRNVGPNESTALRLLDEVNKEDYDVRRVSDVIKQDPTMTVDLLRIANSALYGGRSKITDIQQAAARLGTDGVKKWCSALVVKSLCKNKPNHILRSALLRARMLEASVENSEHRRSSSTLFLIGLLSMMDAIMEMSIIEVLNQVPVPQVVATTLMGGETRYTIYTELVFGYLGGEWDRLNAALLTMGWSSDSVFALYTEAISWYNGIFT